MKLKFVLQAHSTGCFYSERYSGGIWVQGHGYAKTFDTMGEVLTFMDNLESLAPHVVNSFHFEAPIRVETVFVNQ